MSTHQADHDLDHKDHTDGIDYLQLVDNLDPIFASMACCARAGPARRFAQIPPWKCQWSPSDVCVLHMQPLLLVISTRRHPAHPVSVPILRPIHREIQALLSQNHDTRHTTAVVVRCNAVRIVDTGQRDAVPSYWIRQARHRHMRIIYIGDRSAPKDLDHDTGMRSIWSHLISSDLSDAWNSFSITQPCKDCSPVLGTSYFECMSFAPQNGTAVLKGSRLPHQDIEKTRRDWTLHRGVHTALNVAHGGTYWLY